MGVEGGQCPEAWSTLLTTWTRGGLVELWESPGAYAMAGCESHGIPSLISTLECRFLTETPFVGVMASAMRAHGLRLLRHAQDSPRDRWGVFQEAWAALLQAK